jgi:hypothetical protein
MIDPPAQTHSATSIASSRAMSQSRVQSQERWVYETLRRSATGLSDWQLWEKAPIIFDKLSSLHRARIGLLWRSRAIGATPWHPVEDSGFRNRDPDSGKQTVVWRIKPRYYAMTYNEWALDYRALAKGEIL